MGKGKGYIILNEIDKNSNTIQRELLKMIQCSVGIISKCIKPEYGYSFLSVEEQEGLSSLSVYIQDPLMCLPKQEQFVKDFEKVKKLVGLEDLLSKKTIGKTIVILDNTRIHYAKLSQSFINENKERI